MKRSTRRIARLAAILATAVAGITLVQVASADTGSVGLATGILETQFGFSPSRAESWTTGACSYQDRPASCYLTQAEARETSIAEAGALGAYRGMTKQQAQDWSSGVCSYQDKPSSCYPASSKPKDYGPSDPWQIPYLTASPGALSAVFLTDTTDSARVARTHPAIVLSAARSQARIAAGTLRAGFLTDTTDSARVARIGTRGRLASA